MADVSRSPFDLRSWQGLTAVLKAARESNLSPSDYAEFRNLVLEYAQKGGDVAIKTKIDDIIATFGRNEEPKKSQEEKEVPVPIKEVKANRLVPGRRLTPTFTPQKVTAPTVTPSTVQNITKELPVISIGREEVSAPDVPAPTPVIPPFPPTESVMPLSPSEQFESLDDYRARIMEIKRTVNARVGNPVTLMDKGNNIGRTYMTALLGAMKASSPGSTLNVKEAMRKLESAFTLILGIAGEGGKENDIPLPVEAVVAPAVTPSESVLEIPTPHEPAIEREPVLETTNDIGSEIEKEEVPLPVIESSEPDAFEEVVVKEEVFNTHEATIPEPEVEEKKKIKVPFTFKIPALPKTHDENTSVPKKDTVDRWDKDDQNETKIAVREAVDQIKHSNIPTRAVERGRRSYLPSLMDIEESVPSVPSAAEDTAWHAHTTQDELSHNSLIHRTESSMTGVTLGTPQTELMAPDVTAALAQLLHEWNIFSSSGLFGMGPGGVEHPVYQQISRLPMGEVISGRWDNVNPKITHAIKDYVNAWRHEQGIAYSPTETFEHYLRRVAQRILKRKNGGDDN